MANRVIDADGHICEPTALWDEYKRNFAEIRRGAEDDLAAFSGQAFLEAYENAEAAAKART